MHEHHLSTTFKVYDSPEELSPIEKTLRQKALEARDMAYAPYSGFTVGAAVFLENDKIFIGNNQENAAYPSGICAERVAVWSAMSHFPEGKIKKLFITTRSEKKTVDLPVAPCGACRQAIAEYETKQQNNIEIYFTGEIGKIIKARSVKDLLPWMFDNSMLS